MNSKRINMSFLKFRILPAMCLCAFVICLTSCKEEKEFKTFTPLTTNFELGGRLDVIDDATIGLIGPASSVSMNIMGDSAKVWLKSTTDYDYVTLIVDDKNLGRFKIDSTSNFSIPIKFTESKSTSHRLSVYKATEANTGTIIFSGVDALSVDAQEPMEKKMKIEFIGNSITCGSAMDDSGMPCGTDDYKNYHNAYLSYGPEVSRELGVDFLLSSVSGFGIYRGWNTEADEAVNTVPEVYSNLYLDGNGNKERNFSTFVPDVVSICLGTNDLSLGDGTKKREDFNSEQYIQEYIKFIEYIYTVYPDTRVALLNSPMVSGKANDTLVKCLNMVKEHFEMKTPHMRKIAIFLYSKTYQNGCNTHPDIEDHSKMALELKPFFQELLN